MTDSITSAELEALMRKHRMCVECLGAIFVARCDFDNDGNARNRVAARSLTDAVLGLVAKITPSKRAA